MYIPLPIRGATNDKKASYKVGASKSYILLYDWIDKNVLAG